MLYSMTGFGKSENNVDNTSYQIEIRSLNSKGLDIYLRMPGALRHQEIQIRNIIGNQLKRGKIDASFKIQLPPDQQIAPINEDVFAYYNNVIRKVAEENHLEITNILPSILNLPNTFSANEETISDELWNNIAADLEQTANLVTEYRLMEGEELQRVIVLSVNEIKRGLDEIPQFEQERIDHLRERMANQLEQLPEQISIDQNRLEQELIYYIEKLDITEEKVRLASHIDYFLDYLQNNQDMTKGKKLSFIVQEMGREINTIGSKANQVSIQKLVVDMKDNLEQIKEQLSNIL